MNKETAISGRSPELSQGRLFNTGRFYQSPSEPEDESSPESTMEKSGVFNHELFGPNVSMEMRFIRHGEKDSSGHLTKHGKQRARELGENTPYVDHMYFQVSGHHRSWETFRYFIQGLGMDEEDVQPRIISEYSPSSIFLGNNPSEFERKCDERLKWGYDMATKTGDPTYIAFAERLNLQEYLDYGNLRPDDYTTSPRNAAVNMAYRIDRNLELMDTIASKKQGAVYIFTHEHNIASTIAYLVCDGEDFMRHMGRVEYLDEFVIRGYQDQARTRRLWASFRDQRLDFNVRRLRVFAQAKGRFG